MNDQSKYTPMRCLFGAVNEANAKKYVVFREKTVQKFWEEIQKGSLRVLAERRMGKTWVLHLALAMRPDWVAPVFYDAEGPKTAFDFAWGLIRELQKKSLISNDWWSKCKRIGEKILMRNQGKDIEIAKAKAPLLELETWAELLDKTFKDFAKHAQKKMALVIIDEFPLFLDSLIKGNRPEEAISLLDLLRSLRQEIPALRMVFCGSLGLHIVLNKITVGGYTGRPVNDMLPFEVTPLEPEEARLLAGGLLLGEGISCTEMDMAAEAISESGAGVPFYVKHIVLKMTDDRKHIWTPGEAHNVEKDLFEAAGDPSEFAYYEGRLTQYYPGDVAEKARAALDVLCRMDDGLPLEETVNLMRHNPKTQTVDPEEVLRILRILRDDHYIIEIRGTWRFKLGIVRRWWMSARGGLG